MRRVTIPENLDLNDYPPDEIAAAFEDMDRVNRWLGGNRTTRRLLQQLIGAYSGAITLLDVAAGGGGVSRAMQAHFAARSVRIETTLLDRKVAHLQTIDRVGTAAPERHQRVHVSGQRRVVGDALALPFRDSAFDVVICSLFAHHLEPDTMNGFLREALRVCRLGVIVNDLRRSALALALFIPTLLFFRSRVAWEDGVRSVRRAYTVKEMRAMLAGCGARVQVTRQYAFRMGAVVWKQ